MIFAVDFDGTCVTHCYPNIGEDAPYAVAVLKALTTAGHKIIINSMRSDAYLEDAINWYKERGIPVYAANVNPTQKSWTNSPKVHASYYIDDSALGCPLMRFKDTVVVDWKRIGDWLVNCCFIDKYDE